MERSIRSWEQESLFPLCEMMCHPPTLPWVGTSHVPTGAGLTRTEFDPSASRFMTLDFERAVGRVSSSQVSPPTFPCRWQTPVLHPTPPAFPDGGAACELCPLQAGVAWTL